jgi:hypothetical protein
MHRSGRIQYVVALMGWCRLAYCALLMAFLMYTTGCPLLIAGAAGGGAAGAAASAKESDEDHSALTYVGTVLVDVVYVPAKVVFAGLGAVTSGLTYIVTGGDSHPTTSVWNATVKGNYVVTPRMIEGKDEVHFVGPG